MPGSRRSIEDTLQKGTGNHSTRVTLVRRKGEAQSTIQNDDRNRACLRFRLYFDWPDKFLAAHLRLGLMERAEGIERSCIDWKATVVPLNYARMGCIEWGDAVGKAKQMQFGTGPA